jgi:Uri superfamily endonuclease
MRMKLPHSDISGKGGVYVLLVRVTSPAELQVGSLGLRCFPAGAFAYVGSARGGLQARIGRHLSGSKKTFWHIDHLLALGQAEISRVLYRETSRKSLECSAARALSRLHEPVAGFGASDCRCRAHLFRISEHDDRILDLLPGPWEVARV